jgi:hypothetical protein
MLVVVVVWERVERQPRRQQLLQVAGVVLPILVQSVVSHDMVEDMVVVVVAPSSEEKLREEMPDFYQRCLASIQVCILLVRSWTESRGGVWRFHRFIELRAVSERWLS